MKRIVFAVSTFVFLGLCSAGAAFGQPLGVSPGGGGTSPACPTFSWGSVEGSVSYQLAVYESPGGDLTSLEDVDAVSGGPVLSHTVPAPALSWTPSSGQCLGEGDYVWYVGGVDTEGNGGWSAGTAFSVGAVLTDVEFEKKVADAVEKYIARQQALAAAAASGTATYEIIDMTRAADRPIAENTVKAASVIMPNAATPTTGASVYLDGDVALANGGGRVGIGTDNMLAGLHVTSDEGVLFEGGTGGAIPKEGPGTRMMWYPGKAAFRAGHAGGTQWDDNRIGKYSIALGMSTQATGLAAVAMGYGGTWAEGNISTAFGNGTKASGDSSMATGFNTTAQSYAETVVGSYNTRAPSPKADRRFATDRLFGIGNGYNYKWCEGGDLCLDMVQPSDAMVVLKNGNVGFGSSNPVARLDVGNTLYDLGTCPAGYTPGDFDGQADAADCHAVRFVVQNDGNVGIGTTAPGALLDVAGSVRLGVEGSVIQAVQSGTDGLGPNSGTGKASWLITFPTPFAAAPRVIASVRNSGTFTDVFAFSISEVTTDDFKVTVYRVDNGGGNWGQSPLLDWVAIQ